MPVSSILLTERLRSAQLLAAEQDSQASIFRQAALFYKSCSAGSALQNELQARSCTPCPADSVLCITGSILQTLYYRFCRSILCITGSILQTLYYRFCRFNSLFCRFSICKMNGRI